MRAVDLFCGCGGFSAGMRAHFDVVAAADCDEAALRVYARNHPQTEVVRADLSVSDVVAGVPVDVLFGSPPCQDFSNSGKHREADRAQLTVTFAQTVVKHRPRLAVLENVPYLLRTQAFDEICRLWTGAGYSVLAFLVNAAACGSAQDRRRAFVIATTADADLEEIRRTMDRLDTVPPGAPTMASCLDEPHAAVWYCARNRWQPCVYAADRPSPTFRCNCLAGRPASYERRHDDADAHVAHVLSVAEAARIASFSADYFVGESRSTASRLIGNSVPPAMGRVVAGLCAQLLACPSTRPPVVVGAPKPYVGKPGRIEKLLAMHAFEFDGRRLLHVMGSSEAGDGAVVRILKWRPLHKWVVVLRRRTTVRANCDDVYVHVPGHRTEFRSRAQIVRALGPVV